MNTDTLYEEILGLVPFHSDKTDFRDVLRSALNRYGKILPMLDEGDRPDNWNNILERTRQHIDRLQSIATHSYKGLPSSAYNILRNLLSGYQKNDILLWTEVPTGSNFYRVRLFNERRTNIRYDEMFHIPISQRRMVKTQRYSTPGFPCLYIGNSIYGCWEEMGRPTMSSCWASLLKTKVPIKLLDLRIPNKDSFMEDFTRYVQLFPLFIGCMIPVKNGSDIYKLEYIIPQLLIEWIIKNKESGIYYTSAQKSIDFEYPPSKSDNIALPVRKPLLNVDICPELAKIFQISDPLNNEIEQLKSDYPANYGEYDGKDPLMENYQTSNFYYLEERLQKQGLFDL